MDRTMASLSIRVANCGNNSEIWMPGTLVPIALNAEFDFGSQVSIWLGPPSSHSRMQDCALPAGRWVAAALRKFGRLIPRKPSEPTFRKSRRELCIAMF